MKQQLVGLRWIVIVMLCMSSWLAYADKTLILHANRTALTFEVTLPANPTTGYQLSVKQFDASLFQLTSKHYIAPKSKLIGAGGQMVFSFQLLQGKSYPKQTDLSFSYARSWDPSSTTVTKVTVMFDLDLSRF